MTEHYIFLVSVKSPKEIPDVMRSAALANDVGAAMLNKLKGTKFYRWWIGRPTKAEVRIWRVEQEDMQKLVDTLGDGLHREAVDQRVTPGA